MLDCLAGEMARDIDQCAHQPVKYTYCRNDNIRMAYGVSVIVVRGDQRARLREFQVQTELSFPDFTGASLLNPR